MPKRAHWCTCGLARSQGISYHVPSLIWDTEKRNTQPEHPLSKMPYISHTAGYI
jgi:hypothetical protein